MFDAERDNNKVGVRNVQSLALALVANLSPWPLSTIERRGIRAKLWSVMPTSLILTHARYLLKTILLKTTTLTHEVPKRNLLSMRTETRKKTRRMARKATSHP